MTATTATWYSLCGACWAITPDAQWVGLKIGDGLREGALMPSLKGEEPVFYRCPACGYNHVDDDADPGVWSGTRFEMARERASHSHPVTRP